MDRLSRYPRTLTVGGAGLLAAGGILAGVLANGSPSAGATPASTGTIAVTGNGQVTGAPDTLTLQLGVSTTSASASVALATNDSEMEKLQRSFTNAKVPTSDLQTSGLALNPNYDNSGNVSGYQASDQLTVTLHKLSLAGPLIDTAANAVGNDIQIQGISFSISNTSSLLKAARAAAMRDAATAARQLAAAAGATLGPVLKVSDDEQQVPPPEPFAFNAAAARAASSVPVQAGTMPVSVQVRVIYALQS